jgi:hypothetical protein
MGRDHDNFSSLPKILPAVIAPEGPTHARLRHASTRAPSTARVSITGPSESEDRSFWRFLTGSTVRNVFTQIKKTRGILIACSNHRVRVSRKDSCHASIASRQAKVQGGRVGVSGEERQQWAHEVVIGLATCCGMNSALQAVRSPFTSIWIIRYPQRLYISPTFRGVKPGKSFVVTASVRPMVPCSISVKTWR